MYNLLIVFRFVYLSSNKSIAFQNWGTSTKYGRMPNNLDGDQNCVEIARSSYSTSDHWLGPPGSWNDEGCTLKLNFICEKVE